MDYKLKDGSVVSEEYLNKLGEECERGEYPGTPGEWIVRPTGRPKISEEKLVTVAVRFPESMVEAIDKVTNNRSDYIRSLVTKDLVTK